MKKILLMMSLLLLVLLYGCSETEGSGLKVAVTIEPQRAFVEEVGGDLVQVTTIIPPGSSPEMYQPGARQIVEMNEVKVYFTMGVQAETANILPELKDVKVVHLEELVSAAYEDRYFADEEHHDEEDEADEDDHSHVGRDPHIWLSIKRVIVMVQAIADELALLDPDNASTYQDNAQDFILELENLDLEIQNIFSQKTSNTFIVYHPSFGYFADDYGLNMLALEEDGKEPSISHLRELIDYAKANDIQYIFHQAEVDSEQVQTFAIDIDGESIVLYPLSYDYIASLRDMAEKIAEELE